MSASVATVTASQCACADVAEGWVWGTAIGFAGGMFFTLAALGLSILLMYLFNYRRGALLAVLKEKLAGEKERNPYEGISVLESDLGPPAFSVEGEFDPETQGVVSHAVTLHDSKTLTPSEYQEMWERISGYVEEEFSIRSGADLMAPLEAAYVFCIASGEVEQGSGKGGREKKLMKYYTYAKATDGVTFFLAEVVVDVSSSLVRLTLKTNKEAEVKPFLDYFFTAISAVLRHRLDGF